MQPIDLSALNPGIRRTVQGLRHHGFKTVDSGDGVTHEHACDRAYAYVSIRCEPEELVDEAHRLCGMLRLAGVDVATVGKAFAEGELPTGVCIQASYDPSDGFALIDLAGLSDATLPPAWAR